MVRFCKEFSTMKLIKPIILFIVSSFFSLMCSAVTITPIVSENAESDDTDRPFKGVVIRT